MSPQTNFLWGVSKLSPPKKKKVEYYLQGCPIKAKDPWEISAKVGVINKYLYVYESIHTHSVHKCL